MKKVLMIVCLLLVSAIVYSQPNLGDATDSLRSFELPNIPLPNVQQYPSLCVPTAAIAHLATYLQAQEDNWIFSEHDSLENLSHTMNPMFNYNFVHVSGNPAGSAPSLILDHFADQGVIDMAALPYTSDTNRAPINLRFQALKNRGGQTLYTTSVSTAQTWLRNGWPVIGLFRPGTGPNSHCVFIYGYDSDFDFGNGYIGGWKFQDSNGPNWLKGTPYEGPNKMWSFYTFLPSENVLPEFAVSLKSNLFSCPATYKIPDSCLKIKVSFVKNADTLKTSVFTGWPMSNDYLFPIDTLGSAYDAEELVIEASYQVWLYNQTTQPIAMAIDSLASVESGYQNFLSFTAERTDLILDSVVLNPTLIKREFYSHLVAKASLETLGLEQKTSENILNIYPNPAARGTTITLALASPNNLDQSTDLEILSVNGQVISRKTNLNLTGGKIRIGLPELAAGVYLISLKSDYYQTTKKLVVY